MSQRDQLDVLIREIKLDLDIVRSYAANPDRGRRASIDQRLEEAAQRAVTRTTKLRAMVGRSPGGADYRQ